MVMTEAWLLLHVLGSAFTIAFKPDGGMHVEGEVVNFPPTLLLQIPISFEEVLSQKKVLAVRQEPSAMSASSLESQAMHDVGNESEPATEQDSVASPPPPMVVS